MFVTSSPVQSRHRLWTELNWLRFQRRVKSSPASSACLSILASLNPLCIRFRILVWVLGEGWRYRLRRLEPGIGYPPPLCSTVVSETGLSPNRKFTNCVDWLPARSRDLPACLNSGVTDACCHTQLLHAGQGSKLRSPRLCSRQFAHRIVSTASH